MTQIQIDSITKSFPNGDGEHETVLPGISFEIPSGSFTTVMGPSGCGKTTLLNIVAGILSEDSGVIKQDEKPIRPDERTYAYVFQEPRLLPWETVRKNLAFAMRSWGVPEEEHDERIDTYLEMVGLADTADSYPGDLSGGMQQRIGIARALAVGSDVILMDEPFSSLDEITAADLRADLIDLWEKTNKTILFITHDLSEAVYLSDRVFFLGPNGSLLDRYSVDVPRPRSVDNDALIQIESDLRSVLHETIEQGA